MGAGKCPLQEVYKIAWLCLTETWIKSHEYVALNEAIIYKPPGPYSEFL